MCDINVLHNIAPGMKSKSAMKWHTANEIDKQQYNIEIQKHSFNVINYKYNYK